MKCPACQHENPRDARFCTACAFPLREETAEVTAERYCAHCGHALVRRPPASHGAPGAYTPPHLADRILTSRAALEGERKQVTVLFADVENFTRLGERLDLEDLHELMDRVFAVLLEVVHAYEGTVNQFTGDGVMALFGAPVALEDHAHRAVAAALEIQRRMAGRAAEFDLAFGSSPRLRIGLNSGRVVVGKIGDDLRMDYTAQGDTVNLAARLQALAEPGTVAMSSSTAALVTGAVECLALGVHRVKGKEQPVEVFRPVSVRSDLHDGVEDRLAPLVDRERELARLLALYADTRDGRVRAAIVIGDAGVGKSRLVQELRRRAEPEPRWLVGHCVPYGRTTPYRPIVEMLRARFALSQADSEDTAAAKLHAGLAALGDDGPALAPALRWLLGLGEPDPALAVLSPADRKAAITRALDVVIRRSAASTPHVLVVEACQWLDPASEEYLVTLARRLDAVPVLLVFTCRPDEVGRVALTLGGERIVLRPLPPAESRTLVATLAPGLSPELVDLVADRTGGNPLFLAELARIVLETGTARIPPTVEDVLMARVDRLPAGAKAVLQMTAVIGGQFSRTLLDRVVETREPVEPALETLVTLGLLHHADATPDVYTCDQPLVHEVTYEGLLNQQRKALHRKVGEALEAMFANRLTEHVEDLARHFSRAEDWRRAAAYHREAGRKAAALCANTQATRWFQRALEIYARLPEEPELTCQAIDTHLDLCRSQVQLGQLDEVLRLARAAEALAQRLGDALRLGEIYAYVANYHYMKGEPDVAIRYGRLCLGLGAESGASRTRRAARQYLGMSYHVLGDYAMADEILAEQTAALETTDSFDRVGPVNVAYVSSCAWRAFTLAELGEFAGAHDVADRGVRAAARAGHPYVRAIAASFAGMVFHVQGDVEHALPLFETSYHLCGEHQLEVWRPLASALLGHASVLHGKVERGLDLLWEASALNERLGVLAYRGLWTTYLAEGLMVSGQMNRAEEAAERALALAVHHKEQGNATRALHVLGMVLAQQGPAGLERANDHLRQALEQAERLRMRPVVAACYHGLAALARKRHDAAGAARYAGIARSIAGEIGLRFWWERPSG